MSNEKQYQEIEIICEKLRVGDRQTKLDTITILWDIAANKDTCTENVFKMYDGIYLHLLKCYSDRYEAVRSGAIAAMHEFLKRLPLNEYYLANILGTLFERMGKAETIEESEEIRFDLVMQLYHLIKYFKSGISGWENKSVQTTGLEEHYDDIVAIITKASRDSFHEVKIAACKCAKRLSKLSDNMEFKVYANKIAKSLYTILNHKHYEARVNAIKALSHLALHVDASTDDLKQLIMQVSPMLMDTMPPVRRECGDMGILLLLKFRDRYSYFELIIPLVLCCLKDDCEEVRNYIRPRWITVGEQYYEENRVQLNEREISEETIINYPNNIIRPTVGCRGIVQRSLRIVPVITRETKDWKNNVRLHSMKLLYQFVLHAESAMTTQFFEILPDIANACCDEEREVVDEALKVLDLLGRLLPYAEWIETGIGGLERANKEGYLKCFYAMYTVSVNATITDDLRVSQILLQPEYSQSLKLQIKIYTVKMVEKLMRKIFEIRQKEVGDSLNVGMEELDLVENKEEKLENLQMNLYIIIVKVVAISWAPNDTETSNLIAHCESILEDLAKLQNHNVAKLHDKYLSIAYEDVKNLDAVLDANTEPIMLLKGLIFFCNLHKNALPIMQEKVQMVFTHCSGEAKINTFLALSQAMLNWHRTIKVVPEESVELMRKLLVDLVVPHLAWAPGANAEAMRDMATATLAAVSESAVMEARILFPELVVKYMPTLLEDRSCSTRHYAVKCLCNFGPIPMKHMKTIAYGVLQRFDDPSEEVRATASVALRKLQPKFSTEKEERESDQDTWNLFMKKTFELLLIHYESPEIRFKKSIKKTLLTLAKEYEDIARDAFKKTLSQPYSRDVQKDLLSELSFKL